MIREAILATGRPITLATNGTVRERARIDFEHVNLAILDRVLHVHQPADFQRQRQSHGSAAPVRRSMLGIERMRRQRAGAIARMHAGFLDMLHDAGDEGVLAVGQAIDIDFDRIRQIAVEQQRTLRRDHKLRRTIEIAGQTDGR